MSEALSRSEVIKKSTKGTIVSFSSLSIQYLLTFITQVLLARVLLPEHFGALAFASLFTMFFTNLSNTQGDKFLIQRRDKIYDTLDNIFTLEIILALILIFLVVLLTPLFMGILKKDSLILPAQVLTITFLANPLSKPRALLERELDVLRSKIPFILSQLLGGIIGITLAYLKWGLWSLIWWRVSTLLSEAIIIFLIVPYKPHFRINKDIIKEVTSFCWPIFLSSLLIYFYWNIDYYIIGSVLGEKELGYYWLAFQMSSHFLKVKAALNSVLFPAFSRLDNDTDKIKAFNFLSLSTSAIYLIPTISVIIGGDYIIPFFFGQEWQPAVMPFQLFFIVVLIRAISQNSGPFLYAFHQTKQDLALSILNTILIPLFVYPFCILAGITGAALGVLFSSILISWIGFNIYVKPITDKGFFYYFGSSLFLVTLVLLQVELLKFVDIHFVYKILISLFISGLVYFLLFKSSLSALFIKVNSLRKGALL